eukprot:gene4837-5084_t
MRLLVVVASVAICVQLVAAQQPAAPWFCHELDCPQFTVVKNITDIGVELRHYDAGKWASTVVSGVKYDKAVATGFWRLFKYISGDNVGHVKVPMTAPVTVKVTAAQGPFCEDNFTVSFFVPFEHQDNPPQPSAPEVFIEPRPALDVYVKGFGGWAIGTTYLQQAADVTEALQAAGHAITTDFFYTAGYDSPFRLTNRHNEASSLLQAQFEILEGCETAMDITGVTIDGSGHQPL